MTELAFTSDQQAERTVLSVAGEIDMGSAPALRERVDALDVSAGTLVLDPAGVGFVDSSGLGALLGIKKQQDRAGGQLIVANASPAVSRIIDITKMNQVFTQE
jgi:anti-anti-sigma factor